MDAKQREQIAIDIAKMYYIDGLSQDYIARKTEMSRSNISRILKKCISDGLVEVIVHDNISLRPDTAHKISSYFGLKDVIIVPTGSSEEKQARYIGERLAIYLDKLLTNGMLLGISKGYPCYYTARNIKNPHNHTIDVIQLIGNTSSTSHANEPNRLVPLFSSKLNGKGFMLSAPLMVRSKKTKEDLINYSPLVNKTSRKFKNVDVALLEISKPEFYSNDPNKQEWLTKADILQLSEVKAISCICGYYFDINGNSCNVGINDRLIAIERQDIKKINRSIGILFGGNLLDTALSAIKSELINILVIDEALALNLQKYITDRIR